MTATPDSLSASARSTSVGILRACHASLNSESTSRPPRSGGTSFQKTCFFPIRMSPRSMSVRSASSAPVHDSFSEEMETPPVVSRFFFMASRS